MICLPCCVVFVLVTVNLKGNVMKNICSCIYIFCKHHTTQIHVSTHCNIRMCIILKQECLIIQFSHLLAITGFMDKPIQLNFL